MTRKNDPEYKRSRILQAARELFVAQGLHSTSMSQIAERSGVTQSMLHYYFGSKQGLFQTVLSEAFIPLFSERLFPKGSELNFSELIRAAISSRFRFFQKNPDVLKLLSRTFHMDEYQPSALAKEIGDKWIDIYRTAQKRGQIRSDISPEYLMVMYQSLTTYWFHDRFIRARVQGNTDKSPQQTDDEYLDAITRVFLEILQIRENTAETDQGVQNQPAGV